MVAISAAWRSSTELLEGRDPGLLDEIGGEDSRALRNRLRAGGIAGGDIVELRQPQRHDGQPLRLAEQLSEGLGVIGKQRRVAAEEARLQRRPRLLGRQQLGDEPEGQLQALDVAFD